jgi:predicted nuclease of predicted toxin-antitoxin system
LLRKAGHDLVTVNELGLVGQPDSVILAYAKQQNRILLTHNCQDFKLLHQQDPNHPGILLVYRDTEASKNMSRQNIVQAITNLEAASIPLSNQLFSLNQWNY